MLSAADSCSEVALMDMSHYNKDYDTSHPFRVVAPYEPMGDQPEAIESLAEGIQSGHRP